METEKARKNKTGLLNLFTVLLKLANKTPMNPETMRGIVGISQETSSCKVISLNQLMELDYIHILKGIK